MRKNPRSKKSFLILEPLCLDEFLFKLRIMKNGIVAAGGLLIDERRRVLLVHRHRYDDRSFPKGKLDPGETIEEAALREVKEETGLTCRIIRKLAASRYRTRLNGKLHWKVVHLFLMERTGGRIRVPKHEVDRAAWLDLDEAMRLLSYEQDRKLLASF